MIGGQYLDVTGADVDVLELHRLKTGALFGAAVACRSSSAGVEGEPRAAWEAFGEAFGLLFQLADDLRRDGDGARGATARARSRVAAEQARATSHADASAASRVVGAQSTRDLARTGSGHHRSVAARAASSDVTSPAPAAMRGTCRMPAPTDSRRCAAPARRARPTLYPA